jgi:N-methylhydantoinase B
MFFWESSGALVAAIFNALNPVLGDNAVAGDYGSTNTHMANGLTPDGRPWSSATQCGGEHGPWGATKEGDGDSYTVLFTLNNLDPATETIEHDVPVVVLRKEHAIDTGGPGTHRGGAANLKDTLWLADGNHFLSPLRTKVASGVGANGGAAGPRGGMWVFPPDGGSPGSGSPGSGSQGAVRTELLGTSADVYAASEPVAGLLDPETKALDPDRGVYHYFASRAIWQLQSGSLLRCLTNGGGGWGAPFGRDPQRVLRDVRDEYVSIEGAARDYGVVVTGDPHHDPEGLRVDQEATARLRAG